MSETLQHRGYEGSVEFSAEDKMLHGRILNVHDVVSYGGTTVRQLEKNFSDAVDEYLAMCEEIGKIPDKPVQATVNIQIAEDLHVRAARFAEKKHINLHTVIDEALQEYISKPA